MQGGGHAGARLLGHAPSLRRSQYSRTLHVHARARSRSCTARNRHRSRREPRRLEPLAVHSHQRYRSNQTGDEHVLRAPHEFYAWRYPVQVSRPIEPRAFKQRDTRVRCTQRDRPRAHRSSAIAVEDVVPFAYLPPIFAPQYLSMQQQQPLRMSDSAAHHRRRLPASKLSKVQSSRHDKADAVAFILPSTTMSLYLTNAKVVASKKHRYASSSSSESESESAYSSDSSSDDGRHDVFEDERVESRVRDARGRSIRSERFRSIAAMSRLQHSAATLIQQEYRVYRRRRINCARHQQRLLARAHEFLDAFIRDELQYNLVPAWLIESLKTRHLEDLETAAAKHAMVASTAEQLCAEFMTEAVDAYILEVFQNALDAMVREYMTARIDLARAAEPPVLAVARDVLHDWLLELQHELLPEVLEEMVNEYLSNKPADDHFRQAASVFGLKGANEDADSSHMMFTPRTVRASVTTTLEDMVASVELS